MHHRQIEGLGKVEIPLVPGRYRHDGARAVIGQDVVGNPDRQVFAGQGVDGVGAGELAGDPLGLGHPFALGAQGHFFAVIGHCRLERR